MSKVDGCEPCHVKPICDDEALRGVEDSCKQESVSLDPNVYSPEYSHLGDQCVCAEDKTFERMCSAKPAQIGLFKPAPAEPEQPVVAEEKPVEEPVEEMIPDEVRKVSDELFEMMQEIDEEGMLTGMDVQMNDDGTAQLKLKYISPKTGDVVAQAIDGDVTVTEVWESVVQDDEYMMELYKEAGKFLPEGWTVDCKSTAAGGTMSSYKMERVNGKFIPRADKDATMYVTLIPPG